MTRPLDAARLLRGLEAAAAAALAWAVLAPLVALFGGVLADPTAWAQLLHAPGSTVRQAAFTSIWVSAASAIGATCTGAALAGWVARRRFRLRPAVELACLLPLALPPIIGVMAFLFLTGEVGLLRGLVRVVGGEPGFPRFEGIAAVLLVHVYSFAPLAYLLLRDAFTALDGELDAAARSCGAGRWARLKVAWWPQVRGAAGGALWLTFMSGMASFSAPYLLGGHARFLSTEIVARRLADDRQMAAIETVLLAGISLLLLGLRPGGILHRPRRPLAPLALTRRRGLLHGAAAVLVLLCASLPHLTLWLLSFVRDGTWTWQALPPSYTWDNHHGLLGEGGALRPLTHSALMALPATVLAAGWAWMVARAAVVGTPRLRRLADLAAMAPWAVPATALAMGWIEAYNRRTPAGFGLLLTSTPLLLPWAYTMRFVPLQIRAVAAALQARGATLEGVARTLGASPARAARQVTWPLARPALLSASAVVFVSAMGEFVVSILLYVPENRPVSMEIVSQLRVFNLGQAAALGCWLSLMLTVVLALAPRAAQPWGAAREAAT